MSRFQTNLTYSLRGISVYFHTGVVTESRNELFRNEEQAVATPFLDLAMWVARYITGE